MLSYENGVFRRKIPKLSLAVIAAHPATERLVAPTPTEPYPEELTSFIVEQFLRNGTEQRRNNVRTAVGEVVANAVIHGNAGLPDSHIRLYGLWHEHFYAAVCDDGRGFDLEHPAFVPGRSGTPPEGGMGLYYTKAQSDLVYNEGSVVVLAFRAT